jgi:hypothetical protein
MNPSSPNPASSLATAPAAPIRAANGAQRVVPVPLDFERLSASARAYSVAWWTLVAVALLVASGLLWSGADRARFVRLMVPVVVGLTSIPLVVRFCFDRVSLWHASPPAFLRAPPGEFVLWLAGQHRLVTRSALPTANHTPISQAPIRPESAKSRSGASAQSGGAQSGMVVPRIAQPLVMSRPKTQSPQARLKYAAQSAFAFALGVIAVSSPLSGCFDLTRGCKQVLCDTAGVDAGQGSCTTERGTRLLLDNFAAPSFAFTRVQAPNGNPVLPAAFDWTAPSEARAVTCALFTAMPAFECGSITNFSTAVALYDVRRFEDADPREGHLRSRRRSAPGRHSLADLSGRRLLGLFSRRRDRRDPACTAGGNGCPGDLRRLAAG